MEAGTVDPDVHVPEWTDPKRYLWLLGLVVPLLPFITVGLAELTGLGIMYWFGPFLVFGLIPALDSLIGKDEANPPDEAIRWLEQDRYYRWCTYLFIPLQYAGLVFACSLWASGDLSFLENLGLAFSVAMVAGIAINTAHELGHKRKSHEKWLSKVALAQTGYGHFFIEHNRGHHVRVATPEDPASARLGESFWEFLPRTVAGSLRSSLHLERERLERVGHGFWTFRNDVFNAWAMTLVLFGVLVLVFGVEILPWLLIQAVVGFSLLEVVNYLEHYGLLRQWDEEKERYELCRPEHSWNSDNVASNVFLYHLQRHSDHHANPIRRFQALRHYEGLPELPNGYAAMIPLAWMTPLWRRTIDPMVIAHYGGDVTLANLHPRTRERYLARYGNGHHPTAAERAARRRREAEEATTDAPAYECPNCEYVYTVAEGAPREGFPAGTPWSQIPHGWHCPDCGVRDKADFRPLAQVV